MNLKNWSSQMWFTLSPSNCKLVILDGVLLDIFLFFLLLAFEFFYFIFYFL